MASPLPRARPMHTLQEYLNHRMGSFQDHIQEYIAHRAPLPICKTVSHFQRDIHFTFSDVLLERFLQEDLEKPYEAAIKFGFRGYSKGEQNGIFLQRDQDGRMQEVTEGLMRRYQPEVCSSLAIEQEGFDSLRKVKIVWHAPQGPRIVGAYNTSNDQMIFLDFASY